MRDKLLSCKKFFVSLILFSAFYSHAQFNAHLKASYRNSPAGQNLLGTVAYDGLLWGEVDKQRPLYGYYRLGALAGGTPTGAVFAELAPIAPLIFKLQQSSTYRYLDSSVFDCAQVYCFGVMDRTDISVTAVGAYENIVGMISYLGRDIRAPDSSHSVVAEQEYFTVAPGHHSYSEFNLALGYKLDHERTLGLQYIAAEISAGKRRSTSVYAVYQWPWAGIDFTAGGGTYNTDETDVSGTGVILTIGKSFGDSLSLF